jgi:hypothetical protein
MMRAAFLATALLLTLAACTGGGWSVGPGIGLSGPHASNLTLGGGGPSPSTFRTGPGADSPP